MTAIEKGGVIALGNFDGVHRGHQAVIRAATLLAAATEVKPRVLTLEPHPRQFFEPGGAPFRLTPPPVKERLLKALGVHDVITLPFTEALASLPAQQFIDDILVRDYGAVHVIAGYDFVFGHKRGGNMELLKAGLSAHDIGVTEVEPFSDPAGQVMSASRAREALRQGDLDAACTILGRDWSISGEVIHGMQMAGLLLGFPTANMDLGDYLRPKFGVYAVMARQAGTEKGYKGVANIGNRPTVDGKNELLEFHLFDFDGDLYGQEWEVDLLHFIRPEQPFNDLGALRDQIEVDVAAARKWFAQN